MLRKRFVRTSLTSFLVGLFFIILGMSVAFGALTISSTNITSDGALMITGTNAGITIGDSSVTSITFTTAITGNGAVVIPTGAVSSTEILDGTLTNDDISSSAAITLSKLSGVAGSGVNSDITSLSGLTTALSVTQGGTGATTLTGVLKGNGTSAFSVLTAPSGTIVGTSDTQILTNKTIDKASNTLTGVAGSGVNSDITSLSGLTTVLSVVQGGTGLASVGSSGNILRSDGTNFVSTAVTTAQSNPSDPLSTMNTTGVMMGLAASITPVSSGRVLIIISGDIDSDTVGNGAQVQIRTGTGSAPSNGAALTGTAQGSLIKILNPSVALLVVGRMPFSLNNIVTSLTPNTAYWVDVSLAAITGGTARIRDVSISIVEL